jgi:hypothetical protein
MISPKLPVLNYVGKPTETIDLACLEGGVSNFNFVHNITIFLIYFTCQCKLTHAHLRIAHFTYTYDLLVPRPIPRFQCYVLNNIENVGWACGRGYVYV